MRNINLEYFYLKVNNAVLKHWFSEDIKESFYLIRLVQILNEEKQNVFNHIKKVKKDFLNDSIFFKMENCEKSYIMPYPVNC